MAAQNYPNLATQDRKYSDLPVVSLFRQVDKVDQVMGMMREHDYGVFARSAPFVDELLTDDRIYGCSEQRMAALRGCPLEFLPASEKRKAQKVADELGGVDRQSGMWREIISPDTQTEIIRWGLFCGIGLGQIIKRRAARSSTPYVRTWHPQWVRWDYTIRRFVVQTLQGIKVLPRPDEEPNGDGEWLVYCPFGVEYGWRRSLMRPLALKYLSRNWTERDWDRFNELRAMGIVKALFPGNSEPADRQDFLRSIAARGGEAVVGCPQSVDPNLPNAKYDVQFAETGAEGTGWQSYKARMDSLNVDIAVLILGQDSTTEAKPVGVGGSGTANSHTKVALDKTLMDAEFGPAVRAQVLTYWASDNFGDPDLAPWPTFDVMPPEDEVQEATALGLIGDAITKLTLASDRIDVDAILESAGVPLISEEEAAARAAENDNGGGMDGGMGGAMGGGGTNPAGGSGGAAGGSEDGDGGDAGGDAAVFQVGDRVQVKPGSEHMPEHKGVPGTVKIVQDGAYGILFDGIAGVHKWYRGDELESASAKAAKAALSRLERYGSVEDDQLAFIEGVLGAPAVERALETYRARKMAAKNQAAGVVKRRVFAGFPIAVENAAGSIRLWQGPDGQQGSTKMKVDYGFIEGYLGGDGEELDVYVGPDEDAQEVYVVHQLRAPQYKRWDEDKVFIGFASAQDAKDCFLAHRNEPRAFGGMLTHPRAMFAAKLRARDPKSTSKIRAAQDLQRALMVLAERAGKPRAVALSRTVAGKKRAARYEELIIARSTALASRAMSPNLVIMQQEVKACSSPLDLKKRLLRRFPEMDLGALAEVVRRANVLSRLHGMASALEET